ncbi:MAG: integrase core domain-containing protein [Alphaproteobacteria bacterium]|nr:integrase core domain-containing protein [Alphaproteobacteria bacterium]
MFHISKPTYNSKIERSNRVFREEFYADLPEDTIVGASRELMKFLQTYTTYRPNSTGVYF